MKKYDLCSGMTMISWSYSIGCFRLLQSKMQMEKRDGTVLATCTDLRPKCLQLLGMHGCDTVSYPYGQGKIHAFTTMFEGDFLRLAYVVNEVETTHTALMKATEPFLLFFIISLLGIQYACFNS